MKTHVTPFPRRFFGLSAVATPLVGALCALWSLGPSHALAQEGGDASSIVEAEKIPRVLAVGFEDLSSEDCNPMYARYGRCVEEVKFVDLSDAWDPRSAPTEEERARYVNTARLYAEIWESMAYRWTVGSDPITESLIAKEAMWLPPSKQLWEGTARDPEAIPPTYSVYSMPRSTSWLLSKQWVDPRVNTRIDKLPLSDIIAKTKSFYPAVRFKKAVGLVNSDPMVVLRGRFASRLAFDGKPHPYDVMDGDSGASGPLFEQMYPYQRGLAVGDGLDGGSTTSQVPLTSFIVEEQLKVDGLVDDLLGTRTQNFLSTLVTTEPEGVQRMFSRTHQEFEEFYRLIGIQILRFAREEYTLTHLRVLTALMAMHSPPRFGSGGIGGGANNASTKGETDQIELSLGGYSGFSGNNGFRINFDQLPPELIDKHIVTFAEWRNPSPEFKRALLLAIVDELEEQLRDGIRDNPDRYVFTSLDDGTIERWIQDNSFPGRSPVVQRNFRRIAMSLLVERLDEQKQEEVQTEILLDHVNLRIRNRLGGPDSPAAAPTALETATEEEWVQVLATHGMYPGKIGDSPGAVDPVAICTTKDRLEALTEPSFKPVTVDQLVVAPGWLNTHDELLWAVAEDLPFVMIDDPERNPPTITRIVGLPGDRAVYRLRWEVWSGWHLLWGVEPLAEDDASAPRRIALRTAAICDDMVLAPPSLVPTLARAALLDGNFRPTVPVREGAVAKRKKKQRSRVEKLESDQTLKDTQEAVQDGQLIEDAVDTVGDAAAGDAASIAQLSAGAISAMTAASKARKSRSRLREIPKEVVEYIQGLMLTPIQAMTRSKPIVVTVFDHAAPDSKEKIWDFQPHTPYFDAQHKVTGTGQYIHSSGWAWHLPALDAEGEEEVLLAPAHLPTELLSTRSPKQLWKRRVTSDWNFGGGLGLFPYKYVAYGCQQANAEAQLFWANTVVNCASPGGGPSAGSESEGIALDFHALTTQWLIDDRRMAIEFGPEIRLDIGHRGQSYFYDGDRRDNGIFTGAPDDRQPVFARSTNPWTLRFSAGILVGLRFAPDPAPLGRRRGKKLSWGAPRPDGSSFLGRAQLGVRTGFLLAPTREGLEGTALGEFWVGWSVRNRNAKQASLTPYHPAIVLGPFARAMYSFPLTQNKDLFYKVNWSLMAVVGLRAQFRLTEQPSPPELPSVEAPSL